MQQLMKSRIFQLLSEASQNEDFILLLKESYDEFSLKILTKLQLETNLTELYYSLGFVHLELAGICERLSGKEGKKCFKNCNKGPLFDRNEQAGIGMANYRTKQQSQVYS
jgi:hypothetical protein